MELNLFHFHDDVFPMSRFLGQDTSVIKLDVVTEVGAVLGYG
jgi:hypothetical protein